jgi:hypothetical protein
LFADGLAGASPSKTCVAPVPATLAKPVVPAAAVVASRCLNNRRGRAGVVLLVPFVVLFGVTVAAVVVV